jgi:hypothetical protein
VAEPFWTIVTGVAVLIVGQASKSLFLDPALEMRKVLGEVRIARLEAAA